MSHICLHTKNKHLKLYKKEYRLQLIAWDWLFYAPETDEKLEDYQIGLVYLVKKGLDIKNCILCRFYKYNEWQNTHVCIRYKSLGEKYHFPKQTFAKDCPKYDDNPVLLNHSLSELEEMVSEVPI